jgi:hypothetical protein
MKIQTRHIETCMGEITSFADQLEFLTPDEIKEFNKIGHSGKNSKGEETSFHEYLNSLNKGEFDVTKTKWDNGDFMEKYTIVRVTI